MPTLAVSGLPGSSSSDRRCPQNFADVLGRLPSDSLVLEVLVVPNVNLKLESPLRASVVIPHTRVQFMAETRLGQRFPAQQSMDGPVPLGVVSALRELSSVSDSQPLGGTSPPVATAPPQAGWGGGGSSKWRESVCMRNEECPFCVGW